MLAINTITINGIDFIKTISDTYKIKKIGTEEIYTEAVDILNSGYSYEETEELLDSDEIEDSEAVDIITGR